jgi:hypothetical protein
MLSLQTDSKDQIDNCAKNRPTLLLSRSRQEIKAQMKSGLDCWQANLARFDVQLLSSA